MNRDAIIKLAREAGFTEGDISLFPDLIVHFAALVAAHEREACAAICEEYDRRFDIPEVRWCAQDIRARSNT